jgi:pyruvate/2-oxoglutarate dehydrogenase complex dihydrolipoamide acyltransferase (E2) component
VTEDQGGSSRRPATERAEELVDRLGESVGQFASLAGLRLLRVAALAREEAEDVWAEAQSVRRAQSMRCQNREAESGRAAEPIKATDVARRTAEELGVDLREVRGTGVNGRVTAGDVKRKKKESTE